MPPEDAGNELGGLARLALERAWSQWQELDAHLAWCDERIAAHLKACAQARQAEQLIGVGPVTASAVVATVGKTSTSSRTVRSSAPGWGWCRGRTPAAARTIWGRITKRGDTYLRTLLIQGAKSAVMTAHRRDDSISKWAHQLREKLGWQKAVVALANKRTRASCGRCSCAARPLTPTT